MKLRLLFEGWEELDIADPFEDQKQQLEYAIYDALMGNELGTYSRIRKRWDEVVETKPSNEEFHKINNFLNKHAPYGTYHQYLSNGVYVSVKGIRTYRDIVKSIGNYASLRIFITCEFTGHKIKCSLESNLIAHRDMGIKIPDTVEEIVTDKLPGIYKYIKYFVQLVDERAQRVLTGQDRGEPKKMMLDLGDEIGSDPDESDPADWWKDK